MSIPFSEIMQPRSERLGGPPPPPVFLRMPKEQPTAKAICAHCLSTYDTNKHSCPNCGSGRRK